VTSKNPVIALQEAEKGEQAGIAYEAKQPQVERTIQNFDTAVAHATSVTQLLANPAVLNVLLTANNLGSQVKYTALAQKALESNPSSSTALVNQLSDTDWKSAAQTYQFATQGLSVIQQQSVIAQLGSAYAEVEWENTLDNVTPGLSNALEFVQNGTSIASANQILGNGTDRTVVTTALGIPEQIAYQSLQTQAKAVTSRVDVSEFTNNQTYVTDFAERYLLAASAAASKKSASSAASEASLIV
jgi:hypothetical protein